MKNERIGCWLKRVAISACAGTFACVFALPAAAAVESASGEEAVLPLVPYPKSVRLTNGEIRADREVRVVSDASLGAEGYRLSVRPDGIEIAAGTPAGRFYAERTLGQLRRADGSVPCCEIADEPAYAWRGVHIDAARHFFTAAEMKRIIDVAAGFKYNVLHWHLTDDQGWRIPIRKYPRLTTVGAVREVMNERNFSDLSASGTYGPFSYTREEIAEVLAHAKSRHVKVVPEVEIPGHSEAALRAYPELGCFPEAASRPANHTPRVVCAGKDATIRFFEEVLDEVCELFPESDVIHIGGDEAEKWNWIACESCAARRAAHGLKDNDALQSWLVGHFVDYLAKKNRLAIGWDEIMEGGLARNARVMSWRGSAGGIAAAKAGHDVVMTPNVNCYFDYPQMLPGDPWRYPVGWSRPLTLARAYAFDPVAGIPEAFRRHVLGGQCNNWSEQIRTLPELEWKMWPRACATAERLWTGTGRTFEDFERRLAPVAAALRAAGVNVAHASLPVSGQSSRPLHVCYRSFNDQFERTGDFQAGGVMERCFFAANTVKAGGAPYCSYPPIWKGVGLYDFSAFDAQFEALRAHNPDGKFLVIIDLNTPPWLTRRLTLDSFAYVSHVACSEKWFEITEQYMRDLFAYIEPKYGERISGYILSGGGTSEWYEYDGGLSSRLKNEGWRKWCAARGVTHARTVPDEVSLGEAAFENLVYDPACESDKIDYWRFHNGVIADAVLRFAKCARGVLPREREIGVFFGYFLASDPKQVSFGHLDYDRVFASPDIDFLIAPGNYSERAMGAASGQQLITGTARRYGKRFLHEIDFGSHTQTFWRPGTWKTVEDDIAGNVREAAFAIVNHASFWWFDMWGGKNGFYDDPSVRSRIFDVSAIAYRYAADDSAPRDDVLFVADPDSLYFVNERDAKGRAFGEHLRNALGHIGVPYDTCSWNDLATRDLSGVRLVCLPSLLYVDAARAAFLRERICRDGRTVVFTYAPGLTDGKTLDAARVREWAGVDYGTPGVNVTPRDGWTAVYAHDYRSYTPEVLRRLALDAGALAVIDRPATVFMNGRIVAVHSAAGGTFTITLPHTAKRVVDLMQNVPVAEGVRSFKTTLAAPDTKIFSFE